MVRTTLLFVSSLLAVGCGDSSTQPAGGQGGAGAGDATGGAGGADALTATDFLDPAAYDCSSNQSPTPGARPHAFGCLHDPACSSRFVAAHRMGTPFGPENSLSVLRASILLGADVVETDVRSTQDGRVVLIHDDEVDRTLEGSGRVDDLTLAEIQALAMKPKPVDPPGDFSCDHVPTMEQALAVAKGKTVIEFETKETAAAVATARYMKDEDYYDSAYIQCDPDECDAVRAAVPDAPISVRVKDMADLDRVEGYDPPPIVVEIDASQEWTARAVLARIRALGAKPFTNAFYTADIGAALGDVSLYEPIYDKGVDVIQTEFPHLALFALGRAEPLP